MPYTKEQIKERYNKLPADIKRAMDSVDTTNTIVNIGQKYDLMYDQISELVDEVGLTMIGLTPEARFVSNISRRMQVDIGKAMLIAKDINKEVFDKMRDSLKKIEGVDEEGFSEESENAAQINNQFGQAIQLNRAWPEETMVTDAEKAQKESVVSAIEKAGGFVIDKPREDAPLQAEEMVHDAIKENLESKKDIVNVIEKWNKGKENDQGSMINNQGNASVIPASRSEAEAKAIEHNRAWPGIQGRTIDSINNTLDSRIRGNDKTEYGNDKVESSLAPDRLLGDTPETNSQIQSQEKQDSGLGTRDFRLNQLDQSSIVDMLLSKGVAMPMDSSTEKSETSPASQKTEDRKRPYDGTDPYREAVE